MIVGDTYNLQVEGFIIYKSLGGILSKKEYLSAIFAYNKECVRQVIEEAMYFPFGGYMGGIQVIRVNRNYNTTRPAAINWNESNKLKQKYIDQGITPKSKDNPNGKEWLVRYSLDDDQYVLIHWDCYMPANHSTANINRVLIYKFVPSDGRVGVKTQLTTFLKNKELNPLGIHKYPHSNDIRVRKKQ